MEIVQHGNEFWRLYAKEGTTSDSLVDPVMIDALEYEVRDIAILELKHAALLERSLSNAAAGKGDFWAENQLSNKLNYAKSGVDLTWGAIDSVDLARKLGGYGVKCRTMTRSGVKYIVLYDYKKALKTLLPGTIYKANNPKVTSLGFGAIGLTKKLTKNVLVSIIWTGAVEGVHTALSDEKGMGDWLGEVGVSIAVGLGASVLAAGTIILSGGTAVLGGGLLYTGTTVSYGMGLQYAVDKLGLTARAKIAIKNSWNEYWDEQIEAAESYDLEDYEDD